MNLLPTPVANDSWMTVTHWDEWVEKLKRKRINGNGHGKSLAIEAQRGDGEWAQYVAAIAVWAALTGTAAPHRSVPNRDGNPRLNPAFAEWMIGLPAGWVTGIEMSKASMMRLIGNSVVPQQAAYAVGALLDDIEAAL